MTDSASKKLIGLVMGAFLAVCMLAPVKSAFEGVFTAVEDMPSEQEYSMAGDEAIQKQVLSDTRSGLETALTDLLAQNGIDIRRAEIILALTDENRVIISGIGIYINEGAERDTERITQITENNFSIRPQIITEHDDEGTDQRKT